MVEPAQAKLLDVDVQPVQVLPGIGGRFVHVAQSDEAGRMLMHHPREELVEVDRRQLQHRPIDAGGVHQPQQHLRRRTLVGDQHMVAGRVQLLAVALPREVGRAGHRRPPGALPRDPQADVLAAVPRGQPVLVPQRLPAVGHHRVRRPAGAPRCGAGPGCAGSSTSWSRPRCPGPSPLRSARSRGCDCRWSWSISWLRMSGRLDLKRQRPPVVPERVVVVSQGKSVRSPSLLLGLIQ